MRRQLLPSPGFIRWTKRLTKKNHAALNAIRETLTILESDMFDPRLASHKLKGTLTGRWACSAGYDLRIVFELVKQNDVEAIVLVSCGTHDEVY